MLDFLRRLLARPAATAPPAAPMPLPAYPHAPLPADATAEDQAMQPVLEQLLLEMLANRGGPLAAFLTYEAVQAQDAAYRGRLLLATAAVMNANMGDRAHYDNAAHWSLSEVFNSLLRGTVALSEAEWVRLLERCGQPRQPDTHTRYPAAYFFSLSLLLGQLARHAKKQPVQHPPLRALLAQLLADNSAANPAGVKVQTKIREILREDAPGDGALPVVVFATDDPLGRALTEFVAGLDRADPRTAAWLALLQRWPKATAAQPTARLRQELDAATTAIGPEVVREQGRRWLHLLAELPVTERPHVHTYDDGREYRYSTWDFLTEANVSVAKGLIWTLQPLADANLVALLTTLAAKCFRKIPGKGPLAAGLGNACLLTLAHSGLPGVAALARVRGKIRQTNTQELIARHIAQESQKLEVSPAEIEDMAVPDFGLTNGQVVEELGDYTATLTLAEGKAEVQWQKAGKPLKSAPAALKASHAAELKELKAAQTQAQQTHTAQRDRLDHSFVDERRIPWPWFEQYYFRHGLLSLLARPLIWRLHRPDGPAQDALWLDDAWRDLQGQPVPAPTADTTLQLWHPVLASAEDVLAWRGLLEAHQLRQPLRQAFREVYLLTPPEEHTRTYSNRMAAHILKQHQFNSLAKLRGWKYSLLGAYDKGYDSETATLTLPTHNLTAEFWVSEVNADGEWNDTGIWHYVSTDQVRFVRGGEPVPLPEVPPLPFSEVMRDVDLFVGVASVGNDPQWRDNGGLAQYRTYWDSYSFGDLSEVAKTRKLALQRLVPRLQLGRVSEIKGNFLEVQGHRHRYKIHLGSGNILLADGDRYLCIVPDRSAKSVGSSTSVFLPFEGDAVLSIILSKAQLLMNDDQITDPTILRQL